MNGEHAVARRVSDQNTGHGHVYPRPDGTKARCGGPGICTQCSLEKLKLEKVQGDITHKEGSLSSNHQLADFLDHLGAAFARGEYPDDAIHTRRLKLWEAATALRVSSRVETSRRLAGTLNVATGDVTPVCPDCSKVLHKVTRPAGSMLNDDQFDAVRAGDWYCEKCPSNERGNTRYRYFWNWEMRAVEPSENLTSRQHAARNALQGCTCGSDGNLHRFTCQFRREGDDGKGAVNGAGNQT